MMSAYLTASELSDMIGCEPNSYACMRRWLTKHGWPFEANLRGFPRVTRAYHDARLSGASHAAAAQDDFIEPNFGALAA